MTEEKELSKVTQELLERTKILKNNVKSAMMRGEISILKGIIIFETIVKEINPSDIDDDMIAKIEVTVRRYLIEKEEVTQHVDNYVHYGVNRCFLILKFFKDIRGKKIKKKDKFLFTFD